MPRAPRRQKLVLVVDDDPAVRDMVRAQLESLGYLVSTADNAGEALFEIQAHSPDVIITDVYMPGGDGFELMNAMAEFGHDIPTVCMSGCGQNGDYNPLQIASRLGKAVALPKPFLQAALAEAVNQALTGSARP